ncbi:DUF4391 domain-containing protein [Streptomyces sp. NPDC093676]|uniref:DUF4391 domain-containing protein n=1 Tax=Streptomyces sp. NPDC093676 TaxID=3366050 RepID=UPI0037FF303F
MISEDVLAALGLPEECWVSMRVPKTQLIEHGGFATADRRRIQEGIESLRWAAAIKPTAVGIPSYDTLDGRRRIPELQAMVLALRPGASAGRINELIHRVFPYPVLLVTEQGDEVTLSLAMKRLSQAQAGAVVIEGDILSVGIGDSDLDQEFLHSLALDRQPHSDLFALYQGWVASTVALQVAQVTGDFRVTVSPEVVQERLNALTETAHLQNKIVQLRAQAKKERQMARQVRINANIKAVQAELRDLQTKL